MSEYIKLDDAIKITCDYMKLHVGCNDFDETCIKMMMREKTIIDLSELNDYLHEVVANSSACYNCALRHPDDTCFFAAECIKQNFCCFRPGGRKTTADDIVNDVMNM